MKTIVWVYVCTTLQGIMAILIHPILKTPVLPKIIARTSFLLTFMHGPLRSAPPLALHSLILLRLKS